MAYITWNNSFSVKVPDMDNQHKKLVDLVNNLHDAMKQGKGKEQIAKTLDELIKYTVFHFTSEEKLMINGGYENFEEHKAKHEELKQQVLDFQNKYKAGKIVATTEVLTFLQNWLLNHIRQDDMKYSYLAEKISV